jgi:hypothetical protein
VTDSGIGDGARALLEAQVRELVVAEAAPWRSTATPAEADSHVAEEAQPAVGSAP